MRKISVITPWLGKPGLIEDYERAVRGCEVIVINNGSFNCALSEMVKRLNGKLINAETNLKFSAANNIGLRYASHDTIVFLNNDIAGTLPEIQITEKALFGPTLNLRFNVPYIEGWFIAATATTWKTLGGWNAKDYPDPYFEDNDLSLRAMLAGFDLVQTDWTLQYKGNPNPAMYLYEKNQETFLKSVNRALRNNTYSQIFSDRVK